MHNGSYVANRIWTDLVFRFEFDILKEDFIIQVNDGNIAIYGSDMGMKGALILELNDERIIKSELDTVVVSGGGAGFESSGDIRVRNVCKRTQMDLAVFTGYVVNTVVVNGERFGANSGGNKYGIPMQDGEIITSLEYGIWINDAYEYSGSICGLYFVTNIQKHGPYAGTVMKNVIFLLSYDLIFTTFIIHYITLKYLIITLVTVEPNILLIFQMTSNFRHSLPTI